MDRNIINENHESRTSYLYKILCDLLMRGICCPDIPATGVVKISTIPTYINRRFTHTVYHNKDVLNCLESNSDTFEISADKRFVRAKYGHTFGGFDSSRGSYHFGPLALPSIGYAIIEIGANIAGLIKSPDVLINCPKTVKAGNICIVVYKDLLERYKYYYATHSILKTKIEEINLTNLS